VFDFLPAADVLSLANSPLQQVIAQVRFESQTLLGTHEGAGAVHEVLADMYPRLLSEQQQILTMTPTGTTAVTAPQYRITDLNRAWSVVVGPEQLTVETGVYSTWTELRERLDAALKAVSSLVTLRVRERVGLRYTNYIDPDENGSFQGRVSPELLGPAGTEGWKKHLVSMLGQIVARDGDAQLLLRTGLPPQPNNLPSTYLIDIDGFNDQPSKFELDETLSYFDQLNDASYRCFCWSVSESYRLKLAKGN
jgi:uncharacterized protein (TIGR04255 family)